MSKYDKMIITFMSIMHNISNHIIYKILGRTTHLFHKVQSTSKNVHYLYFCAKNQNSHKPLHLKPQNTW